MATSTTGTPMSLRRNLHSLACCLVTFTCHSEKITWHTGVLEQVFVLFSSDIFQRFPDHLQYRYKREHQYKQQISFIEKNQLTQSYFTTQTLGHTEWIVSGNPTDCLLQPNRNFLENAQCDMCRTQSWPYAYYSSSSVEFLRCQVRGLNSMHVSRFVSCLVATMSNNTSLELFCMSPQPWPLINFPKPENIYWIYKIFNVRKSIQPIDCVFLGMLHSTTQFI